MKKPVKISSGSTYPENPVIGVFATSDPRIDAASRERCKNIIGMVAEKIAASVTLANGEGVDVVYSETLVDGEKEADKVAGELKYQRARTFWSVRPIPGLSPSFLLSHYSNSFPRVHLFVLCAVTPGRSRGWFLRMRQAELFPSMAVWCI